MTPDVSWAVVLSVWVAVTRGFNLAPEHAQVVQDPYMKEDGMSDFGYTVALQRRTQGRAGFWLMVGAPRAKSTGTNRYNRPWTLKASGAMYRCSLHRADHVCTPLLLDTVERNEVLNNNVEKYSERREEAWIGGAMDVQDDGDGVVVCGPRWINDYYPNDYLLNGICYLKNNMADSTSPAAKLLPLIASDRQAFYLNDSKESGMFYYCFGQAGMSTHLVQNGQELLIGAPGVLDWEGTVIRYRYRDVNPAHAPGLEGLAVRHDLINRNIPHPKIKRNVSEFGYLGYAVDSGRFVAEQTYYVGGAPRGAELLGSVLVFDFPEDRGETASLDVLAELTGTQFGEYFGSALCVLDVNADGLDDLLVGAPLHSLRSAGTQLQGDEGRVYVFINQNSSNKIILLSPMPDVIMGNSHPGARFGSSIGKIGDVNKDGYNDFVVGAPYEDDGRGAIYLYHGGVDGVVASYSQRVAAADIAHPTPIRGFGISVSRGLDVDDNFFNDIAVGAYSSRQAVLLRARPIITLHASLANNVAQIGVQVAEFVVDSCLSFTGQHLPREVDVHVTLQVTSDNGRFPGARRNLSYKATLNSAGEHCEHSTVEVEQNTADFTQPIELVMHYELASSGVRQPTAGGDSVDGFCKTCPVVNPSHDTFIRRQVSYATGCGNADICKPDLSVTASFEDIDERSFVLGSRNKIVIAVSVRNSGEHAFFATLVVTLPSATPLLRNPAGCRELVDVTNHTTLQCDVANLLRTGVKVDYQLEVSTSTLISSADLIYSFNVSSEGAELTPADNTKQLTLTVSSVADVEIKGYSTQVQSTTPKSIQSFVHSFEVTNHGPSPVGVVSVAFRLPVGVATTRSIVSFVDVFQPTATLNSQPINCRPTGTLGFSAVSRSSNADKSRILGRRSVNDALASPLSTDDALTTPTPDYDLLTTPPADYNVFTPPPADYDVFTTPAADDVMGMPLAVTQLPSNRTLFINCTADNSTLCLEVTCVFGPLFPMTSRAEIIFNMNADVAKLDGVRGRKDIVVVSSSAVVTLFDADARDSRPHVAMATAVIYASIHEERLDWTWLVAAIAGGVFLLLMLIAALAKVGFFRRKKKEELEKILETQSVQNQDNDNGFSIANNSFTPPEEL